MLRSLAPLACLTVTPALADTACGHPNDDFNGLYCLNTIYQQADIDLNAAFGKLRPKLDHAGQTTLKSGQLDWQRERNEQCSKQEDGNFHVNLSCATKTTIARTQFLQDHTRECVSSGCLDSKLQ